MNEYFPLLAIGGLIGTLSIVFSVGWWIVKRKKEAYSADRRMGDGEITRRLLAYAKPYRLHFVFVLLLMILSIAYDIVSPLIIGWIEETVRKDFELSLLFTSLAIYASILIVSLICIYIQAIILQKIGQKIISKLREDLFIHIESFSHAQLHTIPVGKLVTRVTNDTNGVSMMFTDIIVNLAKNIFVILGVIVAMFLLNITLTLMVLCFIPFILLFTFLFRKFSRRAHRKVKNGTTEINTFLSENLSGMKIIQTFNREECKQSEFDKKNAALGRAKQREIFVFSVFRPVVYMLFISSILCLFYIAAKGYIEGTSLFGQTIGSGVVVSFYLYIATFFEPIQSLAEQFNRLQSAFASAEKIFLIFDMQPELTDDPDAVELENVRGEIEFCDVWFSYIPGEWVLKGVSFHVSAGQTAAFVGATGSGKTTVLSLICRNYDVQKGRILIDGIDVRKIKTASLRRHFGQMLQDVFLFSGTVRSNIVLGEEGISDERLWEICRYVNADGFIARLPGGLDEPVRERGNNFSAGQRQLLSFARTIAHRPAVMILDEATANIDTETELLIRDSLEKMMKIGTMLIVAHRLSTIQHADNILVFSHGELVEQGNHKSLLHQKGRYYDLYMLQEHKSKLLGGNT